MGSQSSLCLFTAVIPPPPTSTLFPYTTLFRSDELRAQNDTLMAVYDDLTPMPLTLENPLDATPLHGARAQLEGSFRSEEHTSELQSRLHLVCRLLLEKKKANSNSTIVVHRAAA